MQNFDYYNTPKAKYFGYAEEKAYSEKLKEEIDNKPMTAKEREEALKNVKFAVKEHATKENIPYHKEKKKLEEEFWNDAREELGYDSFLNSIGISLIEQKAYEDGHANGFCEIFYHLSELTDFCREIVKNGIKT